MSNKIFRCNMQNINGVDIPTPENNEPVPKPSFIAPDEKGIFGTGMNL